MVWQIALNGLVSGSLYFLVALSFGVILNTAKFFHFSHAAVIAIAPYTALGLSRLSGEFSLFWALTGIATSLIVGCGLEVCFYRPLRSRESSSLAFLLIALGLYAVLQNLISVNFGDDAKSLKYPIMERAVEVLGGRLTLTQVFIVISSLLLGLTMFLVMRFSSLGYRVRAVSDDMELSRTLGIDVNSTVLAAFALGSALGGFTGLLIGLDLQISPSMGMPALLGGIVVVIIGGTESLTGAFVAAHLIGQVRNLSILLIGSEWQDAALFLVLIAILLSKPQGFGGKKPRKVSVRG